MNVDLELPYQPESWCCNCQTTEGDAGGGTYVFQAPADPGGAE